MCVLMVNVHNRICICASIWLKQALLKSSQKSHNVIWSIQKVLTKAIVIKCFNSFEFFVNVFREIWCKEKSLSHAKATIQLLSTNCIQVFWTSRKYFWSMQFLQSTTILTIEIYTNMYFGYLLKYILSMFKT
jgi:hypothetical protein